MEGAGLLEDGGGVAPPGATPPDIRLTGISKHFGETVAVAALDLEIARGAFFAMIGPSGCGKTTTLRMIGGFEQPTSGTVELAGKDVTRQPPYRRDVNTVFQSYALFPHLDVQRNVAFGLQQRRVPKDEVKRRVAEVLELTQLAGYERRKPAQMSGGQQQRVALARALVNRPQALLLDEPLGALDLRLRKQLQIELKRIQEEVGITFVHVTHDQEEAMTMADEIAVMNEGRIEQRGSATELYERPRTAFVANFLGISNLIDGSVTARAADLADFTTVDGEVLRLPADRVAASNGSAQVGVRPEKITLVSGAEGGAAPAGANVLRGRVSVASFIGVAIQYIVATPSGAELTVIAQNRDGGGPSALGPGHEVLVTWDPVHTFYVSKEPSDAASA